MHAFNDGGRAAAGYSGLAGDCAVRAISIVTGWGYEDVYRTINSLAQRERLGKRKRKISNARTGVYKQTVHRFMRDLGWKWHPTMQIGSGCKVHLRKDELPSGVLLAFVSKHYVAVVDGVAQDTFDPSRGGSRCVYGYYVKE